MIVFSVLAVFCTFLAFAECPACAEEHRRPKISINGNVHTYTVLSPGTPIELLCSGENNQLVLVRSTSYHPLQADWKKLETEIVNDTTIRFYRDNADVQTAFFMCSDPEGICRKAFHLIIDYPPDFRGFHCISNNLNDLNCSWTSRNAFASFTLVEKKEDYKTNVCRFFELDFVPNMYCAWRTRNDDTMDSTVHLTLQGCNYLGCRNESYNLRLLSVLKLDAPRNLRALRIGSHAVLLQWEKALSRRIIHKIDLDHRVEFWYSGVNYISANTSFLIKDYEIFQLELRLPCSDQNYEARVSMKPSQASGEEYWSRYASTYFKTTKEKPGGGVDPTCGKKHMRETPEIMKYKLGEFKDYFHSESLKIIARIDKLKARVAQLNHL